MNTVLKDLAHLGAHEKLQRVEDLGDSLDQAQVPIMSDDLHDGLLRRAACSDAHPGSGITVEQLASKLGVRL